MTRLDATTGKVVEFAISVLKKGIPLGTLDLQFDKSGAAHRAGDKASLAAEEIN